MTPQGEKVSVRVCKCPIRGIVEVYELRWVSADDYCYHIPDPYRRERFLRNFKYCPLCGRPIHRKKKLK